MAQFDLGRAFVVVPLVLDDLRLLAADVGEQPDKFGRELLLLDTRCRIQMSPDITFGRGVRAGRTPQKIS
jgi:hypothetical protein